MVVFFVVAEVLVSEDIFKKRIVVFMRVMIIVVVGMEDTIFMGMVM